MRLMFSVVLASLLMRAHPAAAADWSAHVTPYDGIYPSLELSQARRNDNAAPTDHIIGAGTGLISVNVTAENDNEHVELTMRIPDFDRPERFDATLADAGTDYQLHPPLDWNVPQLRALQSPLSTSIQFALRRDGHDDGTRDIDVTLHPLGEALYFVRDGRDTVDLSWIFTAYVNEHDAIVDEILDDAQTSGIVDHLDGYSSADPDTVYRQVWAVWHAISAHGIRYSSADPSIERGPKVFSQRVRFLSDTWNDRSANCIDGSVLIASVLQRIGVRSFLVLVPGHAYIGFYVDADAQHAAYLETTLLGANVPMPAKRPAFADDMAHDETTRQSLASFSAALAAGRAHHARVANRFDGRHRPDYALIDIAAARAFGIRPIDDAK